MKKPEARTEPQSTESQVERMSIYVPRRLGTLLRLFGARERKPLSHVVQAALTDYLSRREN